MTVLSAEESPMRIFLAPMAGAADSAMRRICRRYGADGCTTEMISSVAVHYKDKKTFTLSRISVEEGPCALQIFGHDPGIMAEAAKALYESAAVKPCAIDINMGCPVKKVVSGGDGSALMRDVPLAAAIVDAVVRVSPVPVTVKMRTGWDREHRNCVELARAVECAGASAITVHGRTRADMYAPGTVDLYSIAEVKAAVSVPVTGNGDVCDADSAREMISRTGVDSLAVGRGALGDPFVFGRIKAALDGSDFTEPTASERIACAGEHLRMMIAEKGERTAVAEARKHMAWYTRGMYGSAVFRSKLNSAVTAAEMTDILLQIEKDVTI